MTELIMPSGTASPVRCSASSTRRARRRYRSGWRCLQPNDHTPNFLELWLPLGAAFDGLSLTLAIREDERSSKSPFSIRAIVPLTIPSVRAIRGRIVGQISRENFDLGDCRTQARLILILAPTEPDESAPGRRRRPVPGACR